MGRKNCTPPTVNGGGAASKVSAPNGKPARGLFIPPPPPVGLGLRTRGDRHVVKVRTHR